MLPELLSMRDKLPPGMYPKVIESANYLWEIAENVLYTDEGVQTGWSHALALTSPGGLMRGMIGQRTNTLAQILFFGNLNQLWRSVAFASPVDVSGASYNGVENASASGPATHWHFVNWGEWTLASNGIDQVQVYKTGPTFVDLTQTAGSLPFTFGRILGKIGPHVFVANTNVAPNEVQWCTADDIHDWLPTANNSAGSFIIRDLEGEIVAGVPLGERYALYSTDSMHVMTYIGAPNYFGFLKVLNGVGAVGPKAVCTVGRENYGLGFQGFFRTDGTSVEYIDEPQFREYFWERCSREQASKTVCYHNEDKSRVEWFVPWQEPTGGEGYTQRGVAYDYRRKAWSLISLSATAAIEREVFQYPIIALDNSDFHVVNTGTPEELSLTSKVLDFGSPAHGKFVSHIYNNTRGNYSMEIGVQNKITDGTTWLPLANLYEAGEPTRVGLTARYFRVRIKATSTFFRMGGIVFYGRGGGTRK